MSQEIASLFARVGAETGDYHKNMRGVRDDLTSSESAMTKFGDVAKVAFQAVAVAVVAVGTAVGAMVASSVSAAADMEQGVADIGAMMTLTTAETDKLKEHILDLGLDPNLKVSATEASAAVMALGTAGLSVTEIMGGASEATVLLANATGLKGEGLASAANIATDVMAQFNIKAEDMNAAVNQIAGTTVASKFSIDDYRLAIAQAGGVAGAVGVDFEDFNAVIAAISPSFASGSDAGTSYKTFLQRLVPTTANAAAKMADLNLHFFDSSGQMKSMSDIADQLNTAFSGLTEEQKIHAASTIFGTDAMRTAFALAEGGAPIIAKMKTEIGKVDAEELAAKRMDTLKGSWEIFQGVVDTLKISMGDKFLPIARTVTEWVSALAQKYGPPLIEWAGKLADKISAATKKIGEINDAFHSGYGVLLKFLQAVGLNEEAAVSIVKAYIYFRDALDNVFAVVKAAIGPIVETIGKYVTWKDVLVGLASMMVGPLLGAFGGIIAGLASFAAPILAVIAATAALRFAWENDLGQIRTMTLNTVQKISNWFFTESGIWKGTWEDTWAYIADRVEHFVKYDIYNFIVGTWAEIKFQTKWNFTIIRDTIVAWANETVQTVTNWKDRALGAITGFVTMAIDKFKNWSGPIIHDLDVWSRVTLSTIERWRDWGIRYIKEWRDGIVERFQGVFDWWDQHIQPWIETGKSIIQGLWNGVKEKWNQFTTWWQGVWQGSIDWVKNLLGIGSPSKVFETIGVDLMAGLTIGIEGASQAPLNAMSSLASQVQTKMTGMIDTVKNSAQTMRDTINNMPALPSGYWSTPAGPTTPTTTPGPTYAPAPVMPYEPPPVQHASTQFGYKNLAAGLNSMAGLVDTSGFVSNIASFANSVKDLLAAQGQPLASSSAEAQVIRDLTGPGIDSRSVNDVLNGIQLLIAEMRQHGLTNALNIHLAPDASLGQQQELQELVAYYNALSGT